MGNNLPAESVELTINPHDIDFIARRTGTATKDSSFQAKTQKVVRDALALYKEAVVRATFEGDALGTYREENGAQVVNPLDTYNRIAYARDNRNVESLAPEDVETSFRRFIDNQRRADDKEVGGPVP